MVVNNVWMTKISQSQHVVINQFHFLNNQHNVNNRKIISFAPILKIFKILFYKNYLCRWKADNNQSIDTTFEKLVLKKALTPLHLTKVVEK